MKTPTSNARMQLTHGRDLQSLAVNEQFQPHMCKQVYELGLSSLYGQTKEYELVAIVSSEQMKLLVSRFLVD